MNLSYVIIIILLLKISNIAKGKTKEIKFPNLWLVPVLFIGMLLEDHLKQDFTLSYEMLLSLMVFGTAGLLTGCIRGKSLRYQLDSNNKIIYKESYLSLIIYILIIAAKQGLRLIGGPSASFIASGLMFFACGSILGKCSYITYRYLHPERI
ncbi:hypothetical protein [Lacrimispora aerotolerans]|jgi:hypothetical protein|uniref:hypothetical protein n=1 Tax=Lacrimispora aerotolerans TaxID=36832 RepID=UPI0005537B5C|nr:hypothetical protein [Lacrimispora aerotolerans]